MNRNLYKKTENLLTLHDSVSNLSDTDGDTATLYAVLAELDHATISYIVEPAGSGSVTRTSESLNPETRTSAGSKTVPNEGYEFIGWDKAFDNVTEDITVTALYRELPIAPAPDAPEPTPEPTAEPPAMDVQTDDLIQTGVSVAPIVIAGGFAGIAAIAARRRKSTKR